jgi:hypothetical protein
VNLTPPALNPDGGVPDVEEPDVVPDETDVLPDVPREAAREASSSEGGPDVRDAAPPDAAPPDGGPPDGPTDLGMEMPPSTLAMGLVGYWKLDVLSGVTTPDSSGLGNNASILGGPTVITGSGLAPVNFPDTGAFHFAQIDAAVVGPVTSTLRPSKITVAVWVRFSSLMNFDSCGGVDRGTQYILHQRDNRGVSNNLLEGIALVKQTDGTFAFILTSNSGVRDVQPSTTKVTGTGVWHHLAGTFDGTNMAIYVDGNRENMWAHPYALDYDTTRSWYLGRTGECGGTGESNYDGKLNGDLDDVRIYNRALSSGEVFLLAGGSD